MNSKIFVFRRKSEITYISGDDEKEAQKTAGGKDWKLIAVHDAGFFSQNESKLQKKYKDLLKNIH